MEDEFEMRNEIIILSKFSKIKNNPNIFYFKLFYLRNNIF